MTTHEDDTKANTGLSENMLIMITVVKAIFLGLGTTVVLLAGTFSLMELLK